MKYASFAAVALLTTSLSAQAGHRIPDRAFEGGGRFEVASVASDLNQATLRLGQAVLHNDLNALNTAVQAGADPKNTFYVRMAHSDCAVDLRPAHPYDQECLVNAVELALILDAPLIAMRLADLGATTNEQILARASVAGKSEIVRAIVTRGYRNPQALYQAFRHNDLPLAKFLLAHGADPFFRSAEMLFHAAGFQNPEAFIELVQAAEAYALANHLTLNKRNYIDVAIAPPADTLVEDIEGDSPLSPLALAVQYHHKSVELVRFLISSGATLRPDLASLAKCDPARFHDNFKVCSTLRELGLVPAPPQ